MRLSKYLTAARIQETNFFFDRNRLSRETIWNARNWSVHFSFNWSYFLINAIVRRILIIAILSLLTDTDLCILFVVSWSWSAVVHRDLVRILCIQSIFEYWVDREGPLSHWRSAIIAAFKTITNSRLIPRFFKLLWLTYIVDRHQSIRVCYIFNWLMDGTLKIM